jgi:hypothetical protein
MRIQFLIRVEIKNLLKTFFGFQKIDKFNDYKP